MSSIKLRLFMDMAIILLMAAAIGLSLNHRLLRDVLAGKPVQKTTQASPPATTTTTPLPIGLLQAKELFDRQEATFVDARDRATYAEAHIKGALPLPLAEFDANIGPFKARVKPEATIVVYCNGFDCHDSIDLGGKL